MCDQGHGEAGVNSRRRGGSAPDILGRGLRQRGLLLPSQQSLRPGPAARATPRTRLVCLYRKLTPRKPPYRNELLCTRFLYPLNFSGGEPNHRHCHVHIQLYHFRGLLYRRSKSKVSSLCVFAAEGRGKSLLFWNTPTRSSYINFISRRRPFFESIIQVLWFAALFFLSRQWSLENQ